MLAVGASGRWRNMMNVVALVGTLRYFLFIFSSITMSMINGGVNDKIYFSWQGDQVYWFAFIGRHLIQKNQTQSWVTTSIEWSFVLLFYVMTKRKHNEWSFFGFIDFCLMSPSINEEAYANDWIKVWHSGIVFY